MDPDKLPTAFLAGNYEQIYQQTSKEFQKEVSLKQLQGLGEDFMKDAESFELQSELPFGDGSIRYAWIDDQNIKGIMAVFDQENTIIGLQLLPFETYPDTDDIVTKTEFALPFEDEWFVFWGGMNTLVNYHYAYENQRYAYDFIILKENRSYEGERAENESYYAFGKNVLAPADGTVVEVENEVEDNVPVGKMNEKQPAGNYVIIDHGNDEYSLLAHFQQSSITVKKGDQVKQGDILGLVGNSGNSSEPHIHFHVADGPSLDDTQSIRINFGENKEFIQGDVIHN